MIYNQLPTLTTATRGGYIALLYAPIALEDTFTRIVDTDGKTIVAPSVLNGWYSMPSISVASRSFSIKTSESKQGELYDISIEGTIPNVNLKAVQELKRLKKSEFAIRMNTLDGTTWLMSDTQYPAIFDFTVDGGGVGSDRSRIKFTFKGKMPYPPYKTI